MAKPTCAMTFTLSCSASRSCSMKIRVEGPSDKSNLTRIRLEQAAREAGWWLDTEPSDLAFCPSHVTVACQGYALGLTAFASEVSR